MRGAITKVVKTYFVTCLNDAGNKETFVVNSSQYKASDEKLLNTLNKKNDSNLVRIERRFMDESAYWMSTEDFLKYAEKGRAVKYSNGHVIIKKIKKRGDLNAKENSSQTS